MISGYSLVCHCALEEIFRKMEWEGKEIKMNGKYLNNTSVFFEKSVITQRAMERSVLGVKNKERILDRTIRRETKTTDMGLSLIHISEPTRPY